MSTQPLLVKLSLDETIRKEASTLQRDKSTLRGTVLDSSANPGLRNTRYLLESSLRPFKKKIFELLDGSFYSKVLVKKSLDCIR